MPTISLIPKENIESILPLIKMLNTSLNDEDLLARLNEMLEQGYECVGVYDNDTLIGISGLWTLTKLYVGRHMEPDNVIIHPDYRNKGIGELLMNWIYNYAREKGCVASELNCYVNNDKGQKFWVKEGYKLLGYHYQKKL
jgi:GNAT superfamily N-acetyltransferase